MAGASWKVPLMGMIIVIVIGLMILSAGPGSLSPHKTKPTTLSINNEIVIVQNEITNISLSMNHTYLPMLSWMSNHSGPGKLPTIPVTVTSIWHNTSFNQTQLNFTGETGNMYDYIPTGISLTNYTFSIFKNAVTLTITYLGIADGQAETALAAMNLTSGQKITLTNQQTLIQTWLGDLAEISGALNSYYLNY